MSRFNATGQVNTVELMNRCVEWLGLFPPAAFKS